MFITGIVESIKEMRNKNNAYVNPQEIKAINI